MPRSAVRVNIDGMPEAAALPIDTPRPPRKLYRSSDGRWLGGVARGLAGHLGLPVIWVRLVFVGLFTADGLGALVYAAFCFFVPLGVGGVDVRRIEVHIGILTRRCRADNEGEAGLRVTGRGRGR